SITGPSVATLFEYESATGRLARRLDIIDGKAFSTGYTYDGNDNVRNISYPALAMPDRRVVGFDLNSENLVSRVYDVQATRDYATGFSYHPSGAVAAFTSGNGVVNTFAYDPQRYWIRTMHAGNLNLSYDQYDSVGNVGQIGDSRTGMTQTFSYDVLDRLKVAS